MHDDLIQEISAGSSSGNVVSHQATERTELRTDSAETIKVLRVLYIFAGLERRCDLRHFLEQMQSTWSFKLVMKEIDLLRDVVQDVQNSKFWESLMVELDSNVWDLLVVTPPCNTHSRATFSWKSSPGPRPVRNVSFPWGFPWLTGPSLRKCEAANDMVLKSFEAISRAFSSGTKHLIEHPEDLGRTSTKEVPASIWQYQELRDLQVLTGAVTWALFQCIHQAPSSKPTRLMSDLEAAYLEPYQGWPAFSKNSKYLGPLPGKCPHGRHSFKLHGRNESGQFRTSPSAAYPPDCLLYTSPSPRDS